MEIEKEKDIVFKIYIILTYSIMIPIILVLTAVTSIFIFCSYLVDYWYYRIYGKGNYKKMDFNFPSRNK